MLLRVGVLGLALSSCVAADLSTRPVFADLTYGQPTGPSPTVKLDFQLYAALQLEVMGPWQHPQAAAACLAALDAAELERIGAATAGAREPATWAARLWPALAPVQALPACAPGFAAEPVLLAAAVGKAAGVTWDFAQLTWLDATRRQETFGSGARALARLARVLAATSPAQAQHTEQPVLALAGGAANGAFTAGFLYELLSARDAALARVPAADRQALDLRARFSAAVGTSVGALLAQLVDFSFVDDTNLSAEQQAYLDACNTSPLRAPPANPNPAQPGCFSRWPAAPFPEEPSISGRPLQRCALKLLLRSFADVDESDLLCAEAGSVARAVGVLGRPRVNLIRFDPLQKAPLDELLRLFGERMAHNGLTRVAVSVETQQSQQLGLDERACPAGERPLCLGSSVMASVVLSGFARPVSQTWSGFEPTGECGMWFDGGLRSMLPALRALSLSKPTPLISNPAALRVLAVDTGRLTPLPTAKPTGLPDAALGALGQYASQQGLNELAFAQRAAVLRDAEVAALQSASAPVATPLLSLPKAADPRVHGVYVPGDVPDWVVAGAGYSFDRYVMRGLFIWGRQVTRVQLGAPGGLAGRLGWPVELVAQLETVIAERVVNDAAFAQWLASYSQPACADFATWRLESGRARINATMHTCVEAADGPRYFTCPAGVWDAGSTR